MAQTLKVSVALFVFVTVVYCRVNVNVRVNAPHTGGSSYGPDSSGKLYGNHNPSLSYRSLSPSGDASSKDQIPTLSERTLMMKCPSPMWKKECEEGSVIIETLPRTSKEVCDNLCSSDVEKCKSFIYDEKSRDCALTTATGGTTQSNGISGPDLPLQTPTPIGKKGRGRSRAGQEDCSEFHFGGCGDILGKRGTFVSYINFETNENSTTIWNWARNFKDCSGKCTQGSLTAPGLIGHMACESYSFWQKPGDKKGICANHNGNIEDLAFNNCDMVSGRIGENIEDLNSCLYKAAETIHRTTLCRSGKCNLDHYGEPLAGGVDLATSEKRCKKWCQDFLADDAEATSCTHYKYYSEKDQQHPQHTKMGMCYLFNVNEETAVRSYTCDLHAGKRGSLYDIEKMEKCMEDVEPLIQPRTRECETIILARDATTSDTLAGVTVTYAIPGQDSVTSTTGNDGTANLGSLEIDITLDIKLEKEGYDTITDQIVIGASCGVPISMALNPSARSGIGRIILSWQKEKPRDLDLHMKSDDDCHIYYSTKSCGDNELDVDNTSGGSNGPETITIKKSQGRKFVVYVKRLSTGNMCKAGAKVSIYPGDNLPSKVVDVPRHCHGKGFWLIGCFGGSLTSFDVRNKIKRDEPTIDMC